MKVTTQEILSALKVALKSRAKTYKDVAEHLSVSEKTVKRLFQDGDCSLSRLERICELINVSIWDLVGFAEQYKTPLAQLSSEQEQFLASHPHFFNYLFLLTLGYTADQIQTRYELSDLSTFYYLKELDALGLIELSANNRYQLRVKGKLLLKLHGPLHNKVKTENQRFLTHVVDNHGKGQVRFRSAYRFMSKDTLLELNAEPDSLFEKYVKLSNRDEAVLARDNLVAVKWAAQVAPMEVFGRWPIEHLDQQKVKIGELASTD